MRERSVALAWGAVAATVLLAWYVWRYGDAPGLFFHFDDYWLLGEASGVRGPLDVFRPGSNRFVLYRPLSQIGYFWVLDQLFRHDPAPYHAVQVLAHTFNAWLVWAVASRVLDSRSLGLGAALIYAAAPGHAISVYWVALFSMTGVVPWYLAGLWWWLRRDPAHGRAATTAVAFVVYLCALLAGEHGVSLPLTLFLASLLLLDESWRSALLRLAPLLLVAVVYVGLKIAYMRYGLAADYPDPIKRAVIQMNYSPAFAPLESLRLLGYYTGCAIGWAFEGSPRATRWYGLGTLMLTAIGLSAWQARSSRTARTVLFGLLMFVAALGPLLLLPEHPYTYYVGTAGAGIGIALMAAARALPRVGAAAPAAVVALVLAGELLVGEPRAKGNDDFRFMDLFQKNALRWLLGVQEAARGRPAGTVVVLPRSVLTTLVFESGGGHRLFLDPPVGVRLSADIENERRASGEVILKHPPLWLQGKAYPGRNPRWDWLRGGPS